MCEAEDDPKKSPPSTVPREITYYHMCKTFHCLPHGHGLLDQDPLMLEAFLLIMSTESKYKKYKDQKDAARKKRNKK